jgi:TRAP-type transport system periplasmic protein
MNVGAEMERFALEAAKADDRLVASIYAKRGAKVQTLDEAAVAKWVALARDSAWKDYAERSQSCAKFMELANKVK